MNNTIFCLNQLRTLVATATYSCHCLIMRKVEIVISEGVMYLASLGHPNDIGLKLGKACYPCSR